MDLSTHSYLGFAAALVGLLVAAVGAWLAPPGNLTLAVATAGASLAAGGVTYAVYKDGLLPGIPREDERRERIEARASRNAFIVLELALILAILAYIARENWVSSIWPILALNFLGLGVYFGSKYWYNRTM